MNGVFIVGWVVGVLAAAVDPAWATPVNTLLLLLTAVAGYFINRRIRSVEDKTDRNHVTTTHAANAAASAADAAAESARIAKELGGEIRDARRAALPAAIPTVPTAPTDKP